jgi:hypothetical protein
MELKLDTNQESNASVDLNAGKTEVPATQTVTNTQTNEEIKLPIQEPYAKVGTKVFSTKEEYTSHYDQPFNSLKEKSKQNLDLKDKELQEVRSELDKNIKYKDMITEKI